MTIQTRYTLPAIDTQYIALTQTVVSGANVILNGDNLLVPFSQGGYQRNISFSSIDDLTGCSFYIVGFSNAAVVIETVSVGPNNDTVYSDNVFSSITSIQVNGTNATNLQVGSGNLSIFPITMNTSSLDFGPGAYGFTIDNPDGVDFEIEGTYLFNPSLSTNIFLAGPHGIFSLQSTIDSNTYRLSPTLAQLMDTVFIQFVSTGGQPIYINFMSL